MPIISVDAYATRVETLPAFAAKIIEPLAIEYLHMTPGLITIRFSFAATTDVWFFDAKPIDRTTDPTFHINTIIGNKTAAEIDIAYFITETRDRTQNLFSNIYPGTTYPEVGNRNKVTVIEMP
jgi:hypothetical protein